MDAPFVAYVASTAVLAFASVWTLVGGRGRAGPQMRWGRAVATGRTLWTGLGEVPLVAELVLKDRERLRRERALRELPTLLDVVTLGLSAGLSFDASLELYCQRYPTTLSDAFFEAMLSWRLGIKGRDEALGELAESLDVAALRRFSAAVSQSLSFGAPLATTLEQQAQDIRDEQRAELEAEIERVPVKMLIPLGTLIVPAMLLAILGPLLGSSLGMG